MTDDIPRGDYNDKMVIANRIERRAIRRFDKCLARLIAQCPASRILDVGCGNGARAASLARERGAMTEVVGVDLPGSDNLLEAAWASISEPNLRFETADAMCLPFRDGHFQLVTAIETLEHFADPERALTEIRRVCSGFLVASVPQEPIWRVLNVAAGRHIEGRPSRRWGDTPGHVNHWSRREFADLLSAHGKVVEVRSRLPWSVALVRLF